MRKIIMAFLLVFVTSSVIYAGSFGVGGFGGANIPIIQEDQSAGSIFGIKGKFKVMNGLVAEPGITFSKYGKTTISMGGLDNTIEGAKVNSYGIDALLGGGMGGIPGFKPYVVAGVAFYNTKSDYIESTTKIGWSAGLGFELNVSPQIGIDIRGKLNVISSEGGGSKKAALVTGGLFYYFGLQ